MSDNPGSQVARKSILPALVIAGVQVGGALLLTLAHSQGMIDEDTVTRGVMVLIGLGLAAIGNAMPKTLDGLPPQSLYAAAMRQAVLRVGGWAMMLGGLAYAGLRAFAPRDMALVGCIVAVGLAMVVTICHTVWQIVTNRRSSGS